MKIIIITTNNEIIGNCGGKDSNIKSNKNPSLSKKLQDIIMLREGDATVPLLQTQNIGLNLLSPK
jgi:hypothetical protein